MTKKEIGLVIGILVLVLGGAAGATFVLLKKGDKASIATTETSQTQELTLTETQANQNTGDSLTVVAGENTANPGQLGSGQVASKPNGGTTAPAKAPGPEEFGQYDQYKAGQSALFGDLQEGSGAEAKSGQKVAVYYKGWLTNGQLFDQSKPGSDGQLQPFIFTLGSRQVITGWEQGVLGMKVGGTRRLIVPPAVGYGAQAQNGIPANSLLVFDVQLLAVQ